MQIRSVGIDLGKTAFHLVALGAAGKVLIKKKFTRKQLLTYTARPAGPAWRPVLERTSSGERFGSKATMCA